jgi:hypothetical protein
MSTTNLLGVSSGSKNLISKTQRYNCILRQLLTVVNFLAADPEVPGSIPGAARFYE